MVLSSKNAGKVTMEGKFLCAVYKKGVGSSSILCHICIAMCITHIVVLEVNWKRATSLNLRQVQVSK